MDSAIESQFRTNGTFNGGMNSGHPKTSPRNASANGTIVGLLSRQNNDDTRGGLFGDEDDETESRDAESSVTSPASVTSPPYWMNHHQRSVSNMSTESVLPAGAITMHDNEASDGNDRNRACWAKSVEITDYVIVNGSATNIGAFVVWNIRVETLQTGQGSYMNIRKRYSEFDDLREKLVKSFPNFEAAVPPLPPKSVISKFRPRFLDKRRSGLQYFLNCIMLNPEFSGSPVLKDFLFS
ncbi:PX domain-containing protein YPT35 [Colletotrichum musicola]|uniref:Endosomal/vacuolar adapter protein YPT35 n=1 Tax=Colletotrichum musicola TaxID=2175873 RepID=A0A8H6KAE2_9PEZI|nr:PX domain-containing protein YPT35 [Colletotrichum musicola]